jgi:hypothetical protein
VRTVELMTATWHAMEPPTIAVGSSFVLDRWRVELGSRAVTVLR